MKAADRFANPTIAVNQLWQTDFTYLKVTGWGWYYMSTILDNFSPYLVAFKLCTAIAAADVKATLDLALQASGLDQVAIDSDRACSATMVPLMSTPSRLTAVTVDIGRHWRLTA